MRDDREFEGTLRGFDDYVNLVLEEVTETEWLLDGAEQKTQRKMIFLNAAGVAMLVPGGKPAVQ